MTIRLCPVRLDLEALDDDTLFERLEQADEQGATWTAAYIRALLKRRRGDLGTEENRRSERA